MRKTRKTFNAIAGIILSLAMVLALLPSAYSAAAAEEAPDPIAAAAKSLEGTGTAENPFKIQNTEDMKTMRDNINATAKYKVENNKAVTVEDESGAEETKLYADAYYILTADIDLAEACKEKGGWAPIGKKAGSVFSKKENAFRGVFDGKGHTISNLSIDQGGSESRLYRFGLFGDNYGTIQNLCVKDAELVHLGFDNGIIAAINYGIIQNCYTSGTVQGSYMTGGIVGSNSGGTIKNCYSTANITNGSSAGCIYGNSSKYIEKEGEKETEKVPVVSNCYYIDTQPGVNEAGVCEPVSAEEFKTGRITWLLQNGQDGTVWEQKLGDSGDAYPKLHQDKDQEDRVYKVTFKLGTLEVENTYVNANAQLKAPKVEVPTDKGYTTGDRWYREETKTTEWNFESDKVEADTVLYSEKTPIGYKITLKLNGGALSDSEGFTAEGEDYTKTYTIESPEFTLPTPEKENYEFLGWTSGGEEVLAKGAPEKVVTIPTGTTGDQTFTAQFRDASAPSVTISIDNQNWESVMVNPTFDLFFKISPSVTVTAKDNLDPNPKVSYYVSTKEIEENKLNTVKDWTTYTEAFSLQPTGSHTNYIVYAKAEDDHGNVVYASTSGLVLDMTAPLISGITDNATVCEDAEFTVTESYLNWVKVDDDVIEAAENGVYCIEEIGTHTVSAMDKAGNETKITVTVSKHEKRYNVTETIEYPDCENAGREYVMTICKNCNNSYDSLIRDIPASGHNWGEWTEIDTPTCDNAGLRTHTCKRCGKTENDNLDPSAHDWEEEYTIDQIPTCTMPGSKSIHCKKCGAKGESEELPVLAHDVVGQEPEKENEVLPSCETDGRYALVLYCRACKTEVSREEVIVPATGHDWTEWEEIDPNGCEDEGMLQRSCRNCKLTQTSNVLASGHQWDTNYTVDKKATCTEDGSESIHCQNCDATRDDRVIQAKGHTPAEAVKENETKATCTESGSYDLVRYCTVCGEMVGKITETAPALGHTWGDWESVEMPDCDDTGTQKRSCTVCGYEETQGLEAAGHDWETEKRVDVEPTCTTEGSQSTHCKNCAITKDSEVIPALGHTWGDWESVEMPDCDDTGTQKRSCTVCGYEETQGLEAAGHDWETEKRADVEPTCTTEGSKSTHCKNCAIAKDSEVIPALGHTWGDWESVEMPDCDDTGTQKRSCTVCGYEETRGLEATGHEWETKKTVDKEPTCTTEGSQSIHCKNCGIAKDSEVIPALGHKPVLANQKDATWTQPGYTGDIICEVCKETLQKGESIAAKVMFEVSEGKDMPVVSVDEKAQDALAEELLTEEDKIAIEAGESIAIALEVENADTIVSSDEQELVESVLTEEDTIGQYLDIQITKYVGEEAEAITELKKPLRLTIELSEELKGTNRVFSIVRLHDGLPEILDDLDDALDTVTFETDRFSTYAIIYREVVTEDPGNDDPNPPAGDDDKDKPNPPAGDDDKDKPNPPADNNDSDKPNPPADNNGDTGNNNANGVPPTTGDSSPISLLFILMGAAAVFVAAGMRKRSDDTRA